MSKNFVNLYASKIAAPHTQHIRCGSKGGSLFIRAEVVREATVEAAFNLAKLRDGEVFLNTVEYSE